LLHVRLTGQAFLPVKYIGKDRFRYDAVVAEIQFVREKDTVTSLVLHQNGREVPAKRSGDAMQSETPEAMAPDEKPKEAAGLEIPKNELEAFTGIYTSKAGEQFTVIRRDDELHVSLFGQAFHPVKYLGKDRFQYQTIEAEFQFERVNKIVTSVVFHQNNREVPAERTGNAPQLIFPDAKTLEGYAGVYDLLPGKGKGGGPTVKTLTFSMNHDTLMIQFDGKQPAQPMFASKADWFDYRGTKGVEFQRDASGAVTGLVLHLHGSDFAGKKR
ncbi:MAG TPA: hypothetical protein VGE67_05925, partial [Haloferula sp.]